MKIGDYEDLINELPFPYSCVKMIFNNKNEVIDYEIIDKNNEFDKLIDIINKNIWIGYLKKVNVQSKNQEFELYFKELKTWYKIKISLREKDTFFVIFIDINKEKEEKNKYKLLLDNSKEIIIVIQDERIIFFNYMLSKTTGFSKEELTNIKIEELVCKEDLNKNINNYNKKLDNKYIQPYQFKLRTKDKSIVWVEVSSREIKWEGKDSILFVFTDVTRKSFYEEALRESEKKKASLIKSMNDIILVLDNNFTFIECYTPDSTSLFLSPEFFLGKNFSKINFPKAAFNLINEGLEKVKKTGIAEEVEYEIKNPRGVNWYSLHITLIDDLEESERKFLCVARDVTKLKESEEELKKERERLNNIIEGTNAGTWELNVKTKELRVDKKCAEMLGYSLEELNPEKLALWKILIHPEDSELTTKTIKKHLSGETEYYEHEYRLKHKNGDYIWILSRGKVLSWDKMQNPLFMFGTNMDITKRKVVEEKIKELSIRDPLTNIYNRRYIFDRLKEVKAKYKRHREDFSIVIIDLDYFKNINDSFGHMAGDFALQEFTKVIQRRLRSFDLLGRYGGEEFIIVMVNCVKEDALKRVETILEEIRETTFEYNGNQINFTFTAGIANSNDFDFNNIALDKLLDTADKRLYKGKELGRNRIISINEIN